MAKHYQLQMQLISAEFCSKN